MYLGEMEVFLACWDWTFTQLVGRVLASWHPCFTEVEISFTRRATVDVSRKNELVF